jgi:hypothetical protein
VRYKVSHGGNEYLEVEYGRSNIKKCIRPALLEWKSFGIGSGDGYQVHGACEV